MSRPDLTDDQLGARIRAACEDRSGRLAVDDRPFDPQAPAVPGLPPAPSSGGRRRLLLAAAAIAVVGALVAAVVLIRPDGSDEVRTAATPAPGAPAGDWLAPSETPFGWDIENVDWTAEEDPTAVRAQLFAPAGGGRLYLREQPEAGDPTGEVGPTVQGQETRVLPAKSGDGNRITWYDGGASVDAEYIGMAEADAVAFLDQLEPRGSDRTKGFDAPAGEPDVLIAEAEPGLVSHKALFEYGDPSSDRAVWVATIVSPSATVAEVESQFVLGPRTELAPSESVRFYDDESQTLSVLGPGRTVTAQASGPGWSDVEAALGGIADTLVPIDEAGLRALDPQASGSASSDPADLTGGPTATSAPLATTTVAPAATTTEPDVTTPSATSSEPLHVPVYRLDGVETTIADLADGRLAIVLLWQPSCAPCIGAVQAIDEVAAAYPDALVVAVAVQASIDEVTAFVAEHGVDPSLLADPIGAVGFGWAVEGVPTVKVVSPEGEVIGSGFGGVGDFEEIDGFVREVLGS